MSKIMLVFYIFMAISFTAFTSEEAINQINADTLQGFTKKAFITTNDFDSIKMAIEKIKIDTESCADTIVDLQLGLSGLSHDERLVREKDLNRIINDFSNISSELLSISGADDQGDGLRENNDLQLQLNEIESELRALQSYVQTYLGHLKSQNEKWYFTKDGALFGENQTMSASGSQISSSVLIGQTFQVAKESKIASIKIRVGSSTPPYANVFISPFATTINTNTFVYANSCSNEGNFIFKYTFNDLQVSPSNIYLLGIRTRQNSSSVSLIKCDDAYLGSTNCLWIGTGARYSLDTIKTYDLIAQPNYDLCFDVDFASQTNIIMGAEGIEIKNETPITIDGYNVATVPDITSRIDNARNNIYQSISNFVFGTNAIADGSITENKISNYAVTASKIANSAVTTNKIASSAVVTSKIANNAVTASKIVNSAVTTNKIANSAVVTSKIANNAVTTSKIANSAVTTNKIANSAIVTSKIANNAVTTSKIANKSVMQDHLSDDLVSNLIMQHGGTITGILSVADLKLKNDGNWHIGTVTNRTDLIIDHQDAFITTLNGDLNLEANGIGSIINAGSFLQLSCQGQCGKVTIIKNSTTAIIAENMSADAVITVTPAQSTTAIYWVNINSAGQATVNINSTLNENLEFYFAILKK